MPAGDDLAAKRTETLRRLAGGLDKQIQEKSRPAFEGMRMTHRRLRLAASKAGDAQALRDLQAALYALAEAWETGHITPCLRGLKTRRDVETVLKGYWPWGQVSPRNLSEGLASAKGNSGLAALRPIIEGILRRAQPQGPVRLYGLHEVKAVDTLKKLSTAPWSQSWGYAAYKRLLKAGISSEAEYQVAHEALKGLAQARRSGRSARKQAIWLKEREVLLHQIPGFFPSPPPVVERILDEAGLETGMRVLEPSAGSGSIADAVREAGVKVDCYEVNHALRDLLELKNHTLVGSDFTTAMPNGQRYDRVLMNPPFEKLQDIDHVRHAYEFLAPGGRLVSIMGEGPFFRRDQKARDFRVWLESHGGWSERLPEGSFQASGTGVNARIVVVEKKASG